MNSEALFDNVFVPACSPALGVREPADLLEQTLIHFDPPGAISAPVDWPAWQRRASVRDWVMGLRGRSYSR